MKAGAGADSTEVVARRHLAAVEHGDPVAMAADYAVDAVLVRGEDRHVGRAAIEAYFATVPDRLGDAVVVFDDLTVAGDEAIFEWHLEGAQVAGRDVIVVRGGAIVHQVVQLHNTDF